MKPNSPLPLRQGGLRIAGAVAVAGLTVVGGLWLAFARQPGTATAGSIPNPGTAATNRHPVIIHPGPDRPMVDSGLKDALDRPVLIACGTCHATTTPNMERREALTLTNFHQGLKYAHGNLTCLSCHNATDYDTLRMADSRAVPFPRAMDLCSQCHGPQRRDYDAGLHGGMNGHWDLTRGGRERHTCVQCHDPHAPAFPLVRPVLPPRDRFSVPPPPRREGPAH